jgi:hypothetical protein
MARTLYGGLLLPYCIFNGPRFWGAALSRARSMPALLFPSLRFIGASTEWFIGSFIQRYTPLESWSVQLPGVSSGWHSKLKNDMFVKIGEAGRKHMGWECHFRGEAGPSRFESMY